MIGYFSPGLASVFQPNAAVDLFDNVDNYLENSSDFNERYFDIVLFIQERFDNKKTMYKKAINLR